MTSLEVKEGRLIPGLQGLVIWIGSSQRGRRDYLEFEGDVFPHVLLPERLSVWTLESGPERNRRRKADQMMPGTK